MTARLIDYPLVPIGNQGGWKCKAGHGGWVFPAECSGPEWFVGIGMELAEMFLDADP
jgi:hypothetical protein